MNRSSLLIICYGEDNKSLIGNDLDQHLMEVRDQTPSPLYHHGNANAINVSSRLPDYYYSYQLLIYLLDAESQTDSKTLPILNNYLKCPILSSSYCSKNSFRQNKNGKFQLEQYSSFKIFDAFLFKV